jgi:hypothetical protein
MTGDAMWQLLLGATQQCPLLAGIHHHLLELRGCGCSGGVYGWLLCSLGGDNFGSRS